MTPMRRALWASCFLIACGGDPAADGGLDAGGGSVDGGALDASALDAGGSDAATADAGDAGSVDAGPGDAGGLDGGGMDAGASDGGRDAGIDAGPPGPVPCASDADCALGVCLVGTCRTITETTHSETGLASIERMVAGADADGTLRLLTDDGVRTRDAVGLPGAFAITDGNVATDMYPLRTGGRQGTPTSHASYTNGDYRWVIVDQAAIVNEDRPIYFQTTAHAPDGTLYVLTLPRYPRGPSDLVDVFPLRLWSPGPSGYEHEDLARTVTTRRDFHLRVDAAGRVEVLEADAFWVSRYRLELGGWVRTQLHTFAPMPTRQGGSKWMNDADGHTHLVHVLHVSATADALTYVELDDAGEVRSLPLTFGDGHAISGDLGFDDDGHVYFLSVGTSTSPDRRPYYLHRVSASGTEERTLLGTLRTDLSERIALAVQPDGDLYVLVYSPTRDLVIRAMTH